MQAKWKYYVLLHAIVFMWGFTAILGKVIELEPLYIVWWRVLIAFVGLGLAMRFMKIPLHLPPKKRLWQIIGVGIIVALHWVTFYIAIDLSTASLGILCLSTVTLHVSWLEPLVMKKPFSWLEFFLGLLVIYGLYFVSGDFDEQEYWALGFGLFSAVCAALFSVFNAKLVQDTPSTQITLFEMITGFVFLSFVLLFTGKLQPALFDMRVTDLLWLLFLGLLCTSFAFLATIEVVKKLGAFTVSLSINLEPVYTIVLAIFLLGENQVLGKDFYLGAAMIIFVVVLNALIKGYQRKKLQKNTI